MKSFLALNLQVAEASAAAMHDMPIVAAAKAIASRQAIIFSFDVCIGLAGPPLSCRVWTSADAGNHSTKLRRRWFGAPTVVLRENRRSRSLMTVRRLTAQCLPPLRNKRNSTGDCHAAEFQTGRCRRWVKKAKYSLRGDVFCFASNNGHRSTPPPCRKSAKGLNRSRGRRGGWRHGQHDSAAGRPVLR